MPTPMAALLEEVSRAHFPNPPATPEEIGEFEHRVGWRLDPDLRAFYLHCNGADLFRRPPDCPYRILPLDEVVRARVAMRAEDTDEWGPASQYVLCYVQDSNYVVVDVSRKQNARYALIDGDAETYPDPEYCEQIAASFAEFLAEAMSKGGPPCYWLRSSQPAPPLTADVNRYGVLLPEHARYLPSDERSRPPPKPLPPPRGTEPPED